MVRLNFAVKDVAVASSLTVVVVVVGGVAVPTMMTTLTMLV